MKLQASRPISPKNLQSQTSSQTKNRLAINRLSILHGRLKIVSEEQATHAQIEQGVVYVFADDKMSRFA
jgi:hypothetical protein